MKLLEHQGKELFRKFEIKVPTGELANKTTQDISIPFPVVIKSQVPIGNRKVEGGIIVIQEKSEFEKNRDVLFKTPISGLLPESLLVEEFVDAQNEYYLSIMFNDTGPAVTASREGGSGIEKGKVYSFDPQKGIDAKLLSTLVQDISPKKEETFKKYVKSLWDICVSEHALLVEINPLFERSDGTLIAGDAKIILDDNAVNPEFRPYIELGGDIAVIASGGGASMLCLDMLVEGGGHPANYVEYSGNPPAKVVEELTIKVLSKPNLKGCWVVGGTANFTDIFETLSGFAAGLKKVHPKPVYPIVVRREGPRREEAFNMLQKVITDGPYNMHLHGPEVSMFESSKRLLKLVKKHEHSN